MPAGGGGGGGGGGASQLKADTGVEWVIETDPESGLASLAFPKKPTGRVLASGADPVQTAVEFLLRYPGVFGAQRAEQLQLVEQEAGPNGTRRLRFAQLAAGQLVDEAELLLSFDAGGGVAHVTGPFYPNLEAVAAQDPGVTAEQALQNARAMMRGRIADAARITRAPSLRVIIPTDTEQPRLVYSLRMQDRLIGFDLAMDAATGALVEMIPLHHAVAASGSGWGSAGTLHFEVDEPVEGTYSMQRAGSATQTAVVVRDYTDADSAPFTSTDPHSWEQGRPSDAAGTAVDVIAHLQTVDGWFREKLNRASFDGAGASLDAFAYVDPEMDPDPSGWGVNAFFGELEGGGHVFGVTTGYNGDAPASNLGVLAHEFTHGVVATTSKLKYRKESGGLNESLADIFAAFIQYEFSSGDPTLIALSDGTALRSLRDPKSVDSSLPDTYQEAEQNYLRKPEDHYGVHSTSSVSNLAWSLMTLGGSHPSTHYVLDGAPLGLERSRELWWATARNLKKRSKFKSAAKANLLAARDLGIEDRTSIGCAWFAVGVLEEADLKSKYEIECPGTGKNNDLGTACGGRDAGWYCTALEARASYRCDGSSAARQEVAYCQPTESCVTTGAGTVGCE